MAALNEAYDLSLFEPQEELLQPKLKVTETKAHTQARATISPHVLFLAAVAIVAVCMMVYSQVVISEISAQVSSAKSELTVLENENRMLKTQLESSLSLRTVEEQVTRQYGMSQAENYQVEYVALSSGDSIQVNQTPKVGIFQKVMEKIENLQEYIGLR